MNSFRRRISTKSKNTVRCSYFVGAFLLSVLLMWLGIKFQANEVFKGHANIEILTEPRMTQTKFAKVGEWGNFLFVSDLSGNLNKVKAYFEK